MDRAADRASSARGVRRGGLHRWILRSGCLQRGRHHRLLRDAAKTCTPLWTAATGGNSYSSPAVANGVVYFGSGDGKLYAFSAAGTTGCSGTPKICTPLWTGATGNRIASSPAVAAHGLRRLAGRQALRLQRRRHHRLLRHPQDLHPAVDRPSGGGQSSPAVANGVVYNGSSGKLYAFSAAGTTGCSHPQDLHPAVDLAKQRKHHLFLAGRGQRAGLRRAMGPAIPLRVQKVARGPHDHRRDDADPQTAPSPRAPCDQPTAARSGPELERYD